MKLKEIPYDYHKEDVLVVEDDPDLLYLLQETLAGHYNFFSATNGRQALTSLKEAVQPALILCDIKMPEMDGIEFFKILNEDDLYWHIPFIFLTRMESLIRYRLRLLSRVKSDVFSVTRRSVVTLGNHKEQGIPDFEGLCQKYRLSEKESLVLQKLYDGKSDKEICEELEMSIGSVKQHNHRIFKKTNTPGRLQLFKLLEVWRREVEKMLEG